MIALYIKSNEEFKQIELFKDEKISITSSIQNINDISKTFTDYSQSFTIPASDTNNQIFRHWYENSLDDSYDQRLRYEGYIEIDTQTFRIGKWQLESASVKNNRIEDYKLTFYGNLLSLSDKFREDKLSDIETLNDYTIEYDGVAVRSSVTSSIPLDIMFPLISSERTWQYGSGGTSNIATSGGSIYFDELFPAIKLEKVFEAIESKYGVTFNGSFLTNPKFLNAYLWLKSSEAKRLPFFTQPEIIDFPTDETSDWFTVNADTDTVSALMFDDGSGFNFDAKFKVTVTFPTVLTYAFKVYKNGNLYFSNTFTNSTVSYTIDNFDFIGDYKFEISTSIATNYTFTYLANYKNYDPEVLAPNTVTLFSGSGSGTISANIDLPSLAHDTKVKDFFSGILKMFNLILFSEDGINYTLEQLENWYYLGAIKDFSEYCITDVNFERIKAYKKIDFQYEKSESLMNRAYANFNQKEYGDLSYAFANDGADYTIKLPFENLLFNKFTETDLQVGYALKPDLLPYKPKPIILYYLETKAQELFFNSGISNEEIEAYAVFGQDTYENSVVNTLNWGVEISSYFEESINATLFNNYYLAYLTNLYSLKSRMLKIKMRLPYDKLINLKLNDRILIRDKRYIINQFTIDLTSFEADFELVQDFRDILFNNNRIINIDSSSKLLRYDFVSDNTWETLEDPDGMIITIDNFDGYVEIDLKENVSGVEQFCSLRLTNTNNILIIIQDA
jgi:hypothetical protein